MSTDRPATTDPADLIAREVATSIIAAQLTRSWADRIDAARRARHIVAALDRAGYTVAMMPIRPDGSTAAPRVSEAVRGDGSPTPDAGDAQGGEGGSAAESEALRDQIASLLEHMDRHEFDPDDYDAQANSIATLVERHTQQAIRRERLRLSAVFTERAKRAGTPALRRHMEIAARVAAPELTPEEISKAILGGNFTVCDIPEDPARGDQP